VVKKHVKKQTIDDVVEYISKHTFGRKGKFSLFSQTHSIIITGAIDTIRKRNNTIHTGNIRK
jgi:hypothetical protein